MRISIINLEQLEEDQEKFSHSLRYNRGYKGLIEDITMGNGWQAKIYVADHIQWD